MGAAFSGGPFIMDSNQSLTWGDSDHSCWDELRSCDLTIQSHGALKTLFILGNVIWQSGRPWTPLSITTATMPLPPSHPSHDRLHWRLVNNSQTCSPLLPSRGGFWRSGMMNGQTSSSVKSSCTAILTIQHGVNLDESGAVMWLSEVGNGLVRSVSESVSDTPSRQV